MKYLNYVIAVERELRKTINVSIRYDKKTK